MRNPTQAPARARSVGEECPLNLAPASAQHKTLQLPTFLENIAFVNYDANQAETAWLPLRF
jgi:hypothetical protein